MLARRGTRCAPVAAARPVVAAPRPTVPVRAASSGQAKATRLPFNMFDLPHKWLSGADTPSTKEQFKYTTYHKYGVLRDDFYVVEVPAIKEAVRRLPKKVKEARDMRLKRASDLYIKRQHLPQDQWTTPYEDVPYLDEYLAEVNKETAIRKAFRADTPTIPYHELQSKAASHFAALHKLRRGEAEQ